MAATSDEAAMARAVTLAARALGATATNPVVGAVVLDASGQPVGEGWHERLGGPHAEVVALAAAGDRASGGTMVVTLEPCAHTGRTGPCTEALLVAGIARVVYAVPDAAEGAGGAAVLRTAGLDVTGGVLAEEAARGNEAWLLAQRLHRPFVTWKTATTLDGRIAAADGSSRWITGPAARADAHLLRGQVDAILVGAGTVLTDDPRLTVRDVGGAPAGRQPLRVVADRRGQVKQTARVHDETAPTLITAAPDPAALLAALFGRDVRHVLLEGGATLAGSFVAAGLVDRVVAYVAPALLGAGPAVLTGIGIATIGDAVRLRIDDVTLIGPDVRITARPESR
ncbi:MAG: bifunctional diaminohydroxyphosphoribosylaminopyrimidine deaminase/5-amino-6-(5-phosphoribosylamino)uracil reductase RibD [Pseudonocardiales bacterium]|nr:MAG: bifunctional diaminohydroxyphosphoribosylaminopyrimidine deaminase/5-amino-6-(5-phosphoribosylamino)uracil reductase RibD [Pseudonocardiales bacterium]